jgi:hypothetical protein
MKASSFVHFGLFLIILTYRNGDIDLKTNINLQIWRVAVKILIKQSRAPDRGNPTTCWLGGGGLRFLTVHVTKYYTGPRNWWSLLNTLMSLRIP